MDESRPRRYANQAQNWWNGRTPATRSLPVYLRRAMTRYFQSGGRQAAALAYYAIFSLFPLALLFAIAVSRFLGPALAQQQISLIFSALLPPAASDALSIVQVNIEQALSQSSSFTLIALIGLVWSGLGLFSNITMSLDNIFLTPMRSLWRQRVIALIMAIALILLLALSFVSSAIILLISSLLFNLSSLWISIGAVSLPIGLNMLIFALLFRYVPARRVSWDAVWPAALFGAIGWELAKAAFGWYLTNVANFQYVYGTLAAGIILLLWAYLIASLFLLSAEICAALNDWHLDQAEQTSDSDTALVITEDEFSG